MHFIISPYIYIYIYVILLNKNPVHCKPVPFGGWTLLPSAEEGLYESFFELQKVDGSRFQPFM